MNTDLLVSVIEEILSAPAFEAFDKVELASIATESYLARLSGQGVCIPWKLRELVVDEVRIETLAIIQKKTYGFLSLRDYRESLETTSPLTEVCQRTLGIKSGD